MEKVRIMGSSLDRQENGNHYLGFKIQPVEFIHGNNLNYLVGNVIKYVCRYGTKNGVIDLDKAIHYIEMIKELEYGKK